MKVEGAATCGTTHRDNYIDAIHRQTAGGGAGRADMTSRRIMFAVAALAAGASFGWTVHVPSMPESPFADTEVSTNMPINRAEISYADLKFCFYGTPTNNLDLRFGTDVNTNGVLDVEEVETRFGWRSGRYFIENARTWEMFDGAEIVRGNFENGYFCCFPMLLTEYFFKIFESILPRLGFK